MKVLVNYRDGSRRWALMAATDYLRWRASIPEGPFRVDGESYASGREFRDQLSVTRLGSRLAAFLGKSFGTGSGRFPDRFQADDEVACPGCGEPTPPGQVARGLCRGCLQGTISRTAI